MIRDFLLGIDSLADICTLLAERIHLFVILCNKLGVLFLNMRTNLFLEVVSETAHLVVLVSFCKQAPHRLLQVLLAIFRKFHSELEFGMEIVLIEAIPKKSDSIAHVPKIFAMVEKMQVRKNKSSEMHHLWRWPQRSWRKLKGALLRRFEYENVDLTTLRLARRSLATCIWEAAFWNAV